MGAVKSVAYSKHTRVIPEKYHINIYDVGTGNLLKSFIPPPAPIGQSKDIKTLSFSTDSRLLASYGYGSRNNGVVYDIESGDVLAILTNITSNKMSGPINSLLFSPDGNILVSGGSDKSVTLFNVQQPGDNKRLEGFRNVAYPYISPQGTYLAIPFGQNVKLQTTVSNDNPE